MEKEVQKTRKRFSSVYDIAEMLNVSENTIRNMVKAKTIPFYRFNSRVLFDDKEISKWIQEKKESNG